MRSAVTGVVLASLMKSVNKEMSIYIIIATVILIFLSVAGTLTEIFDFLENIYSNVGHMAGPFFPVIIKILAVAYITDFTSQLCKDAGEGNP
ncbi:MAG: SpoIIIAC/SpoIIIAD family protein [Anaerovoracaceae bacterium]